MNTSGEAADQVVRMSLEVGEAALKISGTGAKHLAVMLYTVLKEKKKTKGRVRLETLVKSGRPLTVFSVKEHARPSQTFSGFSAFRSPVSSTIRPGLKSATFTWASPESPNCNKNIHKLFAHLMFCKNLSGKYKA